ncbi:T9SS type B sorting domain-containing protein [Flavobacterium eburneipallidum]|uniref:T9SS type B sorting domain-containing protein n=1 Tax=Flavobacterium eburneipallidum TaxID=3003263 RepID=UPI0022ABD1F2|nr:T9SS type B sorting domain-containing protein [Flavobacterium eburneipallidum]
MKKQIRLRVLQLLITLSISSVYANNSVLATPPPTVSSPVYLCQNKPTVPLTATPSTGGTLNWYVFQTGGTALTSAPTPNTTTAGSTTYYVTQTIGGIESTPRTPIVVNIVADNGATATTFICDPSQATTPNSLFFDWSHVAGRAGNSYDYKYSIQGGTEVFGNTSLSSFEVMGLLPGQTATFTILTVLGLPCYEAQELKCSLPCITTTTPTFTTFPTTYCINDTPTLPTVSTNTPAILGTWNPPVINTTAMGTNTYTFTPDPTLFPCATTTSINITVAPIEPSFTNITLCEGDVPPNLDTTSPNGITGTWSPATIDNTLSGTYVFTPTAGQDCTPSDKSIMVTVNPSNAISNLNWTVSNAFVDNQIVTITEPLGANYLYQLDDGPFQTSTVFENVALGTHSITVKDTNGCSEFTNNSVLIINYPKFFTPNADTYNDTWNIYGLKDQLNPRIYIYDLYGKNLTQISPKGLGWDGTYNGHPMPATDYWFTVEYVEQDTVKKFKSHFALKR